MGKSSDIRMNVIESGVLSPYTVNPYAIPEEEVPRFYYDGDCRFMCRCGCIYELRRGDHALIPVKKFSVSAHKEDCPLNARNMKRIDALMFDAVEGKYTAVIFGDISKRPDRRKHGGYNGKERNAQEKISPSGLIKRINLMALYLECERKRSSIDEDYFKYYLADNFSRLAYLTAKDIGSEEGIRIAGTSLENEGYDFFYRVLRGIGVIYTDESGKHDVLFDERFSMDELSKLGKNLFVRLVFKENILPLHCSLPALEFAMRHLNASFTSGVIDFRSDNIVAAGWKYPDVDKDGNVKKSRNGMIFPIADRLSLFRVNRYGVIMDSVSESKAVETVIRLVNKSPDLQFFKPFMASDAFYDGKWMPRGVLKVKGADKDIVIEIFDSMDSLEYLDKVRLRDERRHVYVCWFPTKEFIGVFEQRLVDAVHTVRISMKG